MPRDRAELQAWYRKAMANRIAELRGLRARLEEGSVEACGEARSIGQALRGSGATFGFEHLSDVATLLETSSDDAVLRRVEGLISELAEISVDVEVPSHEWLARAAGVDVPQLEPCPVATVWARVASDAGLDDGALAAKVAEHFSIEVAQLATRSRAALRLVPEALATSARIVPLREDSLTITVATADPTSLAAEIDLTRLTGRTPVFAVASPGVLDLVLREIYGRAEPTPDHETPDQAAASEQAVTPESEPGGEPTPSSASEPAPTSEPVAPASTSDEVDAPSPPSASEVHRPAAGASASVARPWRPGPRPPVNGGRTTERVLVVDDEPSARLLIRTLLEKRGYAVIEAGDGTEALDVARSSPDLGLVVADLNMPRMDGLELIWELRDQSAWGHLPVIVVTGEVDEILETQLLEEGADDYIRKPVDARLFLARVDATIRRARD